MDEEITFDEVRRAVFGQRLRDDHSAIVEDPLPKPMNDLLRALEASEQAGQGSERFQDRG